MYANVGPVSCKPLLIIPLETPEYISEAGRSPGAVESLCFGLIGAGGGPIGNISVFISSTFALLGFLNLIRSAIGC